MTRQRPRAKIRKKAAAGGRVRWYLAIVDSSGEELHHGGFATQREAKARAVEILRDNPDGRRHAYRDLTVERFLVDEWLPAREASGKIAPSTLEGYGWIVRSWIAPRIGGLPLTELGAADLERMYADLRKSGARGSKPLSEKSVRNAHLLMSKALADAARRGLVTMNVATIAEKPPATRAEREAWSVSEVRAFLAAADADRLGPIWRLMLTTGLRRGEALGLQWSDVDLDARSIRIERQVLLRSRAQGARLYLRDTTKGRRARTVRLDPGTAESLRVWKKGQSEDRLAFGAAWQTDGGLDTESAWIVTEPDGRVIHPDTLHDRFVRVAKAAGVKPLPLHGARHTFATIALESGVRPDLVSRALGHATVGFTLDVYVHPSADEELAAADALGAALEATQ
ncbi:MAG: site-specific integrase [Actinomycetota bacterium]